MTSRAPARALVAGLSLSGAMLLGACAGDPPPVLEGSPTVVGPLTVTAPDYWEVDDSADLVVVRAAGCPDAATCPSFEVRHGEALPDPEQAVLGPGATCPGPEAYLATDPRLLGVDDVEVGGLPATLARFEVSCQDGAGEVHRTAEHRQWAVPERSLLVTDRWAFEGLAERLAAATF